MGRKEYAMGRIFEVEGNSCRKCYKPITDTQAEEYDGLCKKCWIARERERKLELEEYTDNWSI